MLKLLFVVITGGIACGKSSVTHNFEEFGAKVLFADQIAHELLIPDTEIGDKVVQLLGPEVLEGDRFNRKKIASLVFEDQNLLHKLEEIIHPELRKIVQREYKKALNDPSQDYPLVVLEHPLYYEKGQQIPSDYVIAVIADKESCKERFPKGPEEYEKRMKHQMDPLEKARLADFVIENKGDLNKLKSEAWKVFQALTKPHEVGKLTS